MQLFAVHRPMEWCNSRGRLLPVNGGGCCPSMSTDQWNGAIAGGGCCPSMIFIRKGILVFYISVSVEREK